MGAEESNEREAPFGVGDVLEADVEDVAFGGEGVAKVSGFVVFVPYVAQGDRVRVEITEVKKQFGRARLLDVLEPSADRVTPRCPHYTHCGGCQYQHIDYPAQLLMKQRQVTEHFRRIGGFDNASIDPIVPCPTPYNYRNRIMVRSQWHKPLQKRVIGFLQPDSRLVEPIEECHIAEPELNAKLPEVAANPPPRNGIKVTLRKFPEDWELPPDSFFQVNFPILPKLVSTIGDKIASVGARYLIDAYCGVGFFALSLADRVERFVGVEIDKPAIKAARRNMETRKVTNGEFVAAATEDVLGELLERFPPRETVVILDPPRKGCARSGLDALRKVQPGHLVYVSCHPATLARDLKIFCEDGLYTLRSVTPLDMFPQTQHMECVAHLELSPGAAS